MNNHTPRDSAQLPPHFLQSGVFSGEHHKWVIDYAERYAREALRAQAASVEPVIDLPKAHEAVRKVLRHHGLTKAGDGVVEADLIAAIVKLYAGAPPAHIPADASAPIWNSIQIASWIGSQLMHEPTMFERAVVCKFVRSLGRHPTLLKHSPQPQAVAASSPATAVDAGIGQQAEYWGGLAQQKADADVRRGVTMPVSYYASTVVAAALQASRQPQAQQAVSEGAGETLTGEDLYREFFDRMSAQGVEVDRWSDLDDTVVEAWEAAAALATKEQRS